MKNLAIAGLVIIAIIYYYASKDPFPDTISFSGEQFKLGTSSGDRELIKTYQYTKSGNINGLNDYVQVFIIQKNDGSGEILNKTESLLSNSYKLQPLLSQEGKFGIFRIPQEQREYFAYSIERETTNAHWILNFVIQSNYAQTPITASQARNNAPNIHSELDLVFNELQYH